MGVEPTNALRASRFSKPFPWASRASLQTEEPAARSSPRRAAANDSGTAGASFPLPLQGSNLDFPDPESGVLPVTPRGSSARSPLQGLSLHGQEKAGDGARTRDPQLGKLMLYQLSYSRRSSGTSQSQEPSHSRPFLRDHRSQATCVTRTYGGSKYNPTGRSLPEPPVRFELTTARLRIECSTPELLWRRAEHMPWRGLEPRRLAAPPPQDGVSTNFTTRANVKR